MLADFQNSLTVVFSKQFATKPMPYVAQYTSDMSLHYQLRNLKFKIQPFLVIAFTNAT